MNILIKIFFCSLFVGIAFIAITSAIDIIHDFGILVGALIVLACSIGGVILFTWADKQRKK